MKWKLLLPKELHLKMNQDGLKVCLRKCPELTFSFMNTFHFCTQSQRVTCPKSHTFTFLAPVGFVILHIGQKFRYLSGRILCCCILKKKTSCIIVPIKFFQDVFANYVGGWCGQNLTSRDAASWKNWVKFEICWELNLSS